MGKKIDLFVLHVALAAMLYFYFRSAFESRAAALALALLSCYLLVKLLRGLLRALSKSPWMRKRGLRRSASGAVMRLACLPREEAAEKLENLLKQCYEELPDLALVQTHPSLRLAEERVFEIWKAHRGKARLVICATCKADPACRMMAASLKAPRVALVDAASLEQLICEHPDGLIPAREKSVRARLHLRRAAALLVNRKNAPRNLLLALSMLLIYLFSGNALYLFSALALIFLAFASLRHAPRPAKLF